jgi:hypothetical protein
MNHLYVCHFSNGRIKIGRSTNPVNRIQGHANRVFCVGIDMVEHRIFRCEFDSVAAETALIEKCTSIASEVRGLEWFAGLNFATVCDWAEQASKIRTERNRDSETIDRLGGPSKLAKLLGYDSMRGGTQRIQNWKKRGIPADVKLKWPELFLTELLDRIKSGDTVEPTVKSIGRIEKPENKF